jgi:multiple sugar transport system substrate-binding protein
VAGKVRFEHCWDGARTALVEAWIADLGALCPGILVENDLRDAASIRDDLVTSAASGSPPSVVMLRSDTLPFFAEHGLLLPLDDLLRRDGIQPDWFVPAELEHHRWQGRTYGLPQVTAGGQYLLFVNTDAVFKLGADPARPIATWQDLEALVEPARKLGVRVLDPTRVAPGMTFHQLLTYANGGRYWDEALTRVLWADEAGVEAADWLLRFVKAQAAPGRTTAPVDADGAALSPDEWGLSKQVCCINGAGWFFQLHQQAQHLHVAAYPFPRNATRPDSAGATPVTGGWTLAMPASAPDQDAAWELVKLATASVSACAFTARQRRPSPLAGCDDELGVANSQPFWPAIGESTRRAVRVPSSPIQPRLAQIGQDMQAEILRADRPPRETLGAAAREAQRLLDEWNARRPT